MSACLDHDQVVSWFCKRKGEVVQVRCQHCGCAIKTIEEPVTRNKQELQKEIRMAWHAHVSSTQIDYQI